MSFIPGANVGPYRIVEQAERNGIATTYTAYQPAQGRYVHVVVLPTVPRDDVPLLRQRQRQLELVASLRHPNLLTVLDHGEHLGVSFIVTELVEADPLGDRLGAPWPLAEAVRVLRPIAAALDYAHEQGVVHGDIRPAMVLLTADGTPILGGFGQTIRPFASDAPATIGEPGRRTPSLQDEIARGQQADRRGLALIAYEMLTGRVVDVTAASFDQPLPPAQLGSPLLSPPVERVLLRELTGEPSDRYPSASAFLTDLAASLETAAPAASAAVPAAPPVADEPRSRWLAVALVFAAVAILGIIVVLARGGLLARPAAAPPPTAVPAASDATSSTLAPAAGSTGTGTAATGPGAAPAGAAPTSAGQAQQPAAGAATATSGSGTPATTAGTPGSAAQPVPTRSGPSVVLVPSVEVPTSVPTAASATSQPAGTAQPAATPAPAPPTTGAAQQSAPPSTPLPPAPTPVPSRIPPTWRVIGDPSGRWNYDEQGRLVGHVDDGASLVLFPETVDDVDYVAQLSTTSCQATMVFRAQDEENLLMAIYIPDGIPSPGSTSGGIWLYQRVEGLDIPVRAVRPPTIRAAGEPIRMRIVTTGPQITILLDDRTALQAVDTAPRSGQLGLMVYAAGGRPCEATFSEIQR